MHTSNKLFLAGAGALIVLVAVGQSTGVIPRPSPPTAKPEPAAATPPQAAPAPADDAALIESRHKFSDYCEESIRSQLSMPATYDPSYFLSGTPQLVKWPDHTTSWTWTLAFKASNAYGAVGRYQAVCTQDLEGKVSARIGLER